MSSKPPIESNIANNGLVFGEALDQTIDNMVSMGFPRNDVIRALHAAYHNPDKALDYLFNVGNISQYYDFNNILGNTRYIYYGTRITYSPNTMYKNIIINIKINFFQAPNQVPTQVISRNPDESAIERVNKLIFQEKLND